LRSSKVIPKHPRKPNNRSNSNGKRYLEAHPRPHGYALSDIHFQHPDQGRCQGSIAA
jgi:hypothetical protein